MTNKDKSFPVNHQTGDIRMYPPRVTPENLGVQRHIDGLTGASATIAGSGDAAPPAEAAPAALVEPFRERAAELPSAFAPAPIEQSAANVQSIDRLKLSPAEAAVHVAPIPQSEVARAEHAYNRYRVVLPGKNTYSEFFGEQAPRLVSAIAPLLSQGDILEVIDAGGSYFAELLVEEITISHASFVELRNMPLSGAPLDDMKGDGKSYRVAWGGWQKRWCIVRPQGGVAREGIRVREEAVEDASQRNRSPVLRQTLA